MAQFLLFFGFRGSGPRFSSFLAHFFRFSALWGGNPLSFPDFLSRCRRHMARLRPGGTSVPYPVRFMLFSFSLRPSARPSAPSPAEPDFPARHFPGCTGKPPRFLPPPLFPVSARPRFPGKGPTFAARLPNAAPVRSFARRRDFPGGPTVYTAPRPIPFLGVFLRFLQLSAAGHTSAFAGAYSLHKEKVMTRKDFAICRNCGKPIDPRTARCCPSCGECLCESCARAQAGICRRCFSPLDRFC